MNIMNWRQVEPGLYSAGQPQANEWTEIARMGIATVINLRPDSEQPGIDERALATAQGLEYISLPIASAQDLTWANVAMFGSLVRQHQANGLLIHCGTGNRVGAMFALSRALASGYTTDEAIDYGRKAGLSGLQAQVMDILAACKA